MLILILTDIYILRAVVNDYPLRGWKSNILPFDICQSLTSSIEYFIEDLLCRNMDFSTVEKRG